MFISLNVSSNDYLNMIELFYRNDNVISGQSGLCCVKNLKRAAIKTNSIVSQLSKCLKFMTFREGCFKTRS